MSTIEKAIEKLGKGVKKPSAVTSTPEETVFQEPLPEPDRVAAQQNYEHSTVANISSILRDNKMLNPYTPDRKLVEEYRKIKRPLLMNIANYASKGENANLIMVTSSLPGEGKTFTSINLAISIAMELDKTVLLIDADVHKPAASTVLGVVDRFGLTDVLVSKDLDLSQVLIRTDVPKVSLLSVGCARDNSNELLASRAMAELMTELSERYPDRVIIIDTSPLLATNEAGLVANLVKQVLVVVEAENTAPGVLEEALSMLNYDDTSVGLVLNKARINASEHKYYYGSYGAKSS